MILFIDTTEYSSVTFAIKNNRLTRRSYKIDPHNSHETLQKLDDFLKSSKIKHSEIKKIIVNKGPGSFTGVRVGVTHALALGYAWDVPVKALAKDNFANLLSV